MVAGNEEKDVLASVLVADVEVAETAGVANSYFAAAVKTVATDAVIELRLRPRR